ncbi:hypothetical protein [Paenarthrobacter sp. NPDC089316]|uniref:hypothetical protein n=1 Tax=unclassified Paenarthrobacter TaxID=2634190 RepID=UPI003431C065
MGYRLHQRIRHVPADFAADKQRSNLLAYPNLTDHVDGDEYKRSPVDERMA